MDGQAVATFAGGCFWCMEPPFDKLDGVLATTSGYTGGSKVDPTYEEVSAGGTGHFEAVQVTYDPAKVSYDQLLEVFWRNVDPLDAGGQFCDRGEQYRTAIFVHDDEQRRLAEQSKQALVESQRLGGPIVTEIVAAGPFYPAEEYHQDYYEKNPLRYKFYRWNCGRDQRLCASVGRGGHEQAVALEAAEADVGAALGQPMRPIGLPSGANTCTPSSALVAHAPAAPQVAVDVAAHAVGRAAGAGVDQHALVRDGPAVLGDVVGEDLAVRDAARLDHVEQALVGREAEAVRAEDVVGHDAASPLSPSIR